MWKKEFAWPLCVFPLKGEVKMQSCPVHVMKANKGDEVELLSFLTSTVGGQ